MAAVSVIVPVYNVEAYLAECLDSIVAQTIKDIEIICVNDGSTDGSAEILATYAAKDKRIRVITQKNHGLSAARNVGMNYATGDYVYFIDSDDTIELHALEVLGKHIKCTHADIVVFGMDDLIAAPSDGWFDQVSSPKNVWYTPFVPYALLYEQGAYPFVWRNIYRRKMLLDNKLEFESNLRYGEDIVYQFCVFPYANRILFISDKLYHYRRLRKDSLTSVANKSTAGLIERHIEMMKRIHESWTERGFMKEYAFDLYCWMLNFVVPDFERVDKKDSHMLAPALYAFMKEAEDFLPYMNGHDGNLFMTLKDLAVTVSLSNDSDISSRRSRNAI